MVWFRRDLRLTDNPAWAAATAGHGRLTALFVLEQSLWETAGDHRRTQLLAHLHALDASLAGWGGRLMVKQGPAAAAVGAFGGDVYFNADYSPFAVARDAAVEKALAGRAHRFHGSVVHPPGRVLTDAGDVYKVFTPFYRRWRSLTPSGWPEAGEAVVTDDPGDGLPAQTGTPLMEAGEKAARRRLEAFLDHVDGYPEERDRPDLDTTSRLSADLKFGTLAPRTVLDVVGDATPGREAFTRQLAWRDFYATVLHAFPFTRRRAIREGFDAVRWRNDPADFTAWQEGRTGYPIVDAGMRQLAAEGWMHNRVRMITASFLVKDLLIDWRWGERYFMKLLVDGDVAQNVGNWQWVAGTGTDAAPYFRIFNPVTQSRKFDPEGDYIRRWVPELRALEGSAVHAPWEAGPLELTAGGVILGESYPLPIVDHAVARAATLAAYQAAGGQGPGPAGTTNPSRAQPDL